MRLSHPHTLATLHLPPAQPAVTASTDKPLPTRIPGHRTGHPGLAHHRLRPLPAVGIPYEELSALSAAANRGQSPPIKAPGHAHHDSLMSRQLLLQRANRRIPHIDGAIITPAGQARAIRAPGHAPEPDRVRTI